MAQQFYQYGNKYAGNNSDDLEHYRIEIKKLKEINIQQREGFQKKIQTLERMLKEQGHGSGGYNKNYMPAYTPSGDINNEIVRRDRQINRLSQQNERLRRNYLSNPDAQLIKRRELFDQSADKDVEIMKLKKTIYELEAKYDGKYFNDTKMRNQYDLVLEENKKLRKEMQINYNANLHSKRASSEVNNQLLEGIRYKKQYELMQRENQLLKNQFRRLSDEHQNFKREQGVRINAAADLDELKHELNQSHLRNQQLINNLRNLQNQNNMLRTQGMSNITNHNIIPVHESNVQNYTIKQDPQKNVQTYPNSPERRRHHIFKNQSQQNSPNQSAFYQQNQTNSAITQNQQMIPVNSMYPQQGQNYPNQNINHTKIQQSGRYSNSSYVPSQSEYRSAQMQPIPQQTQQVMQPIITLLPTNQQQQQPFPSQVQQQQQQPIQIQNLQQPPQQIQNHMRRQILQDEPYQQLGTPLNRQQREQLRKFSQLSPDSVSQKSRSAEQNQGQVMQQKQVPKIQRQPSGPVPEGMPRTEKKRSYYEQFNISEVTQNLVNHVLPPT